MSDQEAGKYAYNGLDRVLHEKARLGILTSLFTHPEGLGFVEIKSLCALTDGNLSRHLQVLEREELVEITKSHRNTTCRLTANGRERYLEYLEELQTVLKAAASQQADGEGFHAGFHPA